MGQSRPPSRPARTDDDSFRVGWKMAGVGLEVVSCVLAGALIGWGIDWLRGGHTRSGVIIGALVGIVVGMWNLLKSGLRLNRQLEESERRRRAASPRHSQPGPSAALKEFHTDDDAGDSAEDAFAGDDWKQWWEEGKALLEEQPEPIENDRIDDEADGQHDRTTRPEDERHD